MKRILFVLVAFAVLAALAACVANPRLGVGLEGKQSGGELYLDAGQYALANPVPGAPQAPQACVGPECEVSPMTPAGLPPLKLQVEAGTMPGWLWPILILVALVVLALAFRDRLWPPRPAATPPSAQTP